ncbi:hypothetical protein [Prescottella sp. R16]|uniref:hypothetical protein n=1 Tax=Prescottella sp. R16 TaxID=3064529 RepID=UPI00272EB179|nr:hypothetical protein [Prescottella sp. R16]
MRAAFCDGLFRLFGHRVCCGPLPDWTASVGQTPWDTFDVKPWNLYNMLWRVQQWICAGMTQ